MAKQRRRPIKRRKRRQRARGGGVASNLSGTTVHSHLVFSLANFEHRTYGMCMQVFTMSKLCGQWNDAFSEMMVTRVNIRMRSRYPTSDSGLYAIMVVDNTTDIDTFTWSESWWRTIACYPGAKVRKKFQDSNLVWYPSEMGDINYFFPKANHAVFSIVYCADYSEGTGNEYLPRGSLELRVTMKGRMLPKRNINMEQLVTAVKRNELALASTSHSDVEEGEIACDFENVVHIKSP